VPQRDPALPTGLTVDRQAVYDPESETVQLTITYSAQNAPLQGPFLEIIPGTGGGDCPTVSWDGPAQEQNVPSSTGILTPCGWSIDPGTIPKQGSAVVTATVPLAFDADDPGPELQAWLDDAAAATLTAVTDGTISTDDYPAQRLQGIEVVAPSSVVSQTPLRLTVLPVWPNGSDQLNPIYKSPSFGEPTSVLTAVAGGEEGIRFSDGCSGALAVPQDGLTVTALNPATDCSVLATVGNFPQVQSTPFDIVTRGS
jgi:serine/threonine-protein kinase